MKAMKTTCGILVALLCLLPLAACSPSEDASHEDKVHTPPPAEPPAASPTTFAVGDLIIQAMPDSPKFQGASLTLTGLDRESSLEPGKIPFNFAVEGYELGAQTADVDGKGIANSAKGQHIHLILNNDPYSAHYEAPFEKEMEAGHYVAVAFLSRSYHESVKSPGAAVATQFTVGTAGEVAEADLASPHLIYSRPKGTYKGADTEALMLDFYLLNTTISADGNKVRATINGNEVIFSEWVPYVIKGLPMGEVEISLELIDAEGNLIPGPFNQVTRTVTLAPADES